MTREERVEKFNNIISFVKKDAHNGLNLFYNEYGRMILAIARAICKAEDKANSVMNKVLIRIWKSAKKINGIKNPESWIYTMTKNFAKTEISERWDLELKENILSTEDCFKGIEDRDSFDYIIRDLDDYEKEIMFLRFFAKFSFQELADIFLKPLPSVTSTYYRAIIKLKKKFIRNN